jgi:Rap1a immunity proteins
MKSAALSLVLATALFTTPSHADQSTPLVELCEQYVALPKSGEVTSNFIQLKSSCAGFINSHVKMSKPEDGFCVPKGYSMDDLPVVYLAWVKKNPARISEPTKVTMTEALTEVYPCPK